MSGDHNQYQKDKSYLDFECPRCGHCCQALEKPKYRRGDRLLCLETEEYCVIHISGTDRQYVKFPDGHVGQYTNQQVADHFELLPKEVDADDTRPQARSLTDELMDCVDRLGSEADTVDPRVWQHLLVYAPKHEQEPVAWRTFDGEGGYDYRSYEMNETYDKEWSERNPNHKGWVEPLYTAPPKREWVGLTKREVELIDEMIETQLLHAERCDHMANSTMAQKQKAWDLERVELLRKLKEKNT